MKFYFPNLSCSSLKFFLGENKLQLKIQKDFSRQKNAGNHFYLGLFLQATPSNIAWRKIIVSSHMNLKGAKETEKSNGLLKNIIRGNLPYLRSTRIGILPALAILILLS